MSETKVISEGKRFREIIKDGKTIHQEKDHKGNWVERFSIKSYNKKDN